MENNMQNGKSASQEKDEDVDPRVQRTIKKYWELSDRRKGAMLGNNVIQVNQFHNWGTINNVLERSPILQGLINETELKLPVGKNYTDLFRTIVEELELKCESKEMTVSETCKRENPGMKVVVLRVDSVPTWAFQGFGLSISQATEAASMNGTRFLIAVSSDKFNL